VSLQSDFNAQHTEQEKVAMLLMMFGCDDSDIELCRHADTRAIHDHLTAIMLTDEVGALLRYLRS